MGSATAMSSYISVVQCRKRLAALWFIGTAIVLLILMILAMGGRYSSYEQDVWNWFLPAVVPTFSLMVGVFLADLRGMSSDKHVDPSIYRLAACLSIAYFSIVLLTILLQPFIAADPLELLQRSNLWLTPLQALVTLSLGAFFVQAEQAKESHQ